MGSIERREREREDKRRQILDAARDLFVTEGYQAVTMRKVADKVEYTPTAIYLHFKDKEELVREVVTQDFIALAKHFGSIAEIEDPIEGLRAMGQGYLEFAVQYPNHYRLMFMTQLPRINEELPAHHGNPSLDAYALLCTLVHKAIEQRLLRSDLMDVEFVAQLFWAGVHGIAALRTSCVETDSWLELRPIQALGSEMIEALMAGLRRVPSVSPIAQAKKPGRPKKRRS
jgi:AcrR family transcriptional regulator